MHKEDDAMQDIVEKVKGAAKGIVATFKKIKKAVDFFMTQVRNGSWLNNIGVSSYCDCYNTNKNHRKLSCKVV